METILRMVVALGRRRTVYLSPDKQGGRFAAPIQERNFVAAEGAREASGSYARARQAPTGAILPFEAN